MVRSRDEWYDEVIPSQAAACEPEWVPAEHPLFLLYTSGSTGKPKGVQHSTAGYMMCDSAALNASCPPYLPFRFQRGRGHNIQVPLK